MYGQKNACKHRTKRAYNIAAEFKVEIMGQKMLTFFYIVVHLAPRQRYKMLDKIKHEKRFPCEVERDRQLNGETHSSSTVSDAKNIGVTSRSLMSSFA